MPYSPVKGSSKRGICGVAKVKRTKSRPIKHIVPKAKRGFRHRKLFALNKRNSVINAPAAEMKKIIMLSQSGDLPNIPL